MALMAQPMPKSVAAETHGQLQPVAHGQERAGGPGNDGADLVNGDGPADERLTADLGHDGGQFSGHDQAVCGVQPHGKTDQRQGTGAAAAQEFCPGDVVICGVLGSVLHGVLLVFGHLFAGST